MAETLHPLYQVAEDGTLRVFTPFLGTSADVASFTEGQSEAPVESTDAMEAGQYTTGDYTLSPISSMGIDDYYRSPTLVIPTDFYTRVKWSREYYEQEGWIDALENRDIAQAIKSVEFQFPEDENPQVKDALNEWRQILNRDIGHDGGLDEYNRGLALTLKLDALNVTLANWGTMEFKGKFYKVPRVFVDLETLAVVPDFNSLTGAREYYLRLSAGQLEAIKNGTATGFLQMIPDAAERLIDNLEFMTTKLKGIAFDPTFFSAGPYLALPADKIYAINMNARHNQRWPKPSLTPIFGAIAMKRKLQLADFAVADGMVNMLMIWEFPIGTKASDAKKVIDKFIAGGRVQSHSVPSGVKLSIVTPPHEVLESAEKFWEPVSEIMVHYDFPLNARSRGAGDVDSGPLDLASNRSRLDVLRDYVTGHNNFYLKEMAKRNNWDFELTALMPRTDLANTDAFRAFMQGIYDRGKISDETLLDAAGTTLERELARRKREKALKIDEVMEIRPTFSQTTATAADGRPPKGGGIATPNDKQTRTSKDRPAASSQGNTTIES